MKERQTEVAVVDELLDHHMSPQLPVARMQDPAEAAPGTIRGDFGLEIGENIVHGSDSPESAERELGIFFG